jgi:predicted nucleic acid-binding Zn ribbon protein
MASPFPYFPRRPPPPRSSLRQQALAQWRGWNWSGAEIARQAAGKSAGAVMPRVLADLRMDRRQAEAEIARVWRCQMDPNLVAHAQPAGIRNGTLFVTVDSSVWLDEIVRYRRREILERLQNSFGREMIRRISFRLG